MEDFEGDALDAFDAPNAPDATTTGGGQENDFTGHNREMIRQPEVEMEGMLGGNLGVLKATSGNGAKRLKHGRPPGRGKLRRPPSNRLPQKSSILRKRGWKGGNRWS